MISTVFLVRKYQGEYDGISISEPDSSYDSSRGYSISFRLLVSDGTQWVCTDDTIGAAVWAMNTTDSFEIHSQLKSVTESLCKYLDNYFRAKQTLLGIGNLIFTQPAEITTDAIVDFTDYFIGKDCLWISGASRCDGAYTVAAVDAGSITVSQQLPFTVSDDMLIKMFASSFPYGLQEASAAFVAYDLWERKETANGLTSESIGSYSYNKELFDISGVGYPSDMVAALSPWKRPKVR